MSEEADVIIVGAGIAGLSAGLAFAKQGLTTIILEKNPRIGMKIRGEVINPDDPIFETIFGTGLPPDLIELWYEEALYYSPSCKKIARRSFKEKRKVNINYRHLIETLSKKVSQSGVNLILNAEVTDMFYSNEKIQGVKVEHLKSERIFTAPLIIGADGHDSTISRLVGLPVPEQIQLILKSLAENISLNNEKCIEFFLLTAPPAVLWIFPKSKNLAEVGCSLWNLSNSKIDKEALMQVWQESLNHHPLFKDRLANARFSYQEFDGLPFGGPNKNHFRPPVFLLGDAAGQVGAVGGSGIISSMTIGTLVGDRLGSILKGAGKLTEEDLAACGVQVRKSDIGKYLISEKKTAKLMRDVLYKILKTPEEIDAQWDKFKGPIESR